MRSASSVAQAAIETQYGKSPRMVVSVDWGDGEEWYADSPLAGYKTRLIGTTNVRTQIKEGQVGTVGSVTVTISDFDRALLDKIDDNCLIRRFATVYLEIDGELITLLRGRVSTPVVWIEDSSTLEFDVVSLLEGEDVLHQPDDDLQPWPLVFGSVRGVPAVVASQPEEGTVREGFDLDAESFRIEHDELTDGVQTLDVDGERILGELDGSLFTITERNLARATVNSQARTSLEGTKEIDPRWAVWSLDGEIAAGYWMTITELEQDISSNFILEQQGDQVRGQLPWLDGGIINVTIGRVADIKKFPSNQAYYVHPAGARVREVKDYVWVANRLSSTAVYRVRAYRTINERRKLVTVPPSYYTVNLNDSSYSGATTITMSHLLSERGVGWEDQLYVTLASSEGDNIVDQIQYFVENFTDLEVDATSFAAVHDLVAKYPARWALTSQSDVVDLIANIAWQARLAVTFGATVKVHYLSKEPEAVIGLNDDLLIEASFQRSTTSDNDLVTRFIAKWKPNYAADEDEEIIYENNVEELGLNEEEFNFFIYQERELVVKSASWWAGIRSRFWERVRANVQLPAITVEAGDGVKIVTDLISTAIGRARVTEFNFDRLINSLEVDMPFECGQSTVSEHAYTDDDSDTKPAAPAPGPGEEVYDRIEAQPVDLSSTGTKTKLAKALIDETDGVFTADVYPGTSTTGTPEKTAVAVTNVGTSPVKAGDTVQVTEADTGDTFTFKSSASGVFRAKANADQSGTSMDCTLYSDAAGTQEFAIVSVLNFGNRTIQANDTFVVYQAVDGTYFTEQNTSASTVYRGTVLSRVSSTTWNVQINLDADTTSTLVVTQMQGGVLADIVAGTKTLVLKEGDRYYMQVPVWRGI